MAIDPDDFLDPPYGLGECNEITLRCTAKCAIWEQPEHEFNLYMRNRGNLTQVIIPELIFNTKGQLQEDIIQFSLPENNNLSIYLGSFPNSNRFLTFGLNGCKRNSDEITHETCSCVVDMDFAGNFYIAPEENDKGFSFAEDSDQLGIFCTSFFFSPNHTPPEEDESEPEPKTIRLT